MTERYTNHELADIVKFHAEHSSRPFASCESRVCRDGAAQLLENQWASAMSDIRYWQRVAAARGEPIVVATQRPTCDAGVPTQTTCRRCPEPHVVSWTARAGAPTVGDVARGQYLPPNACPPRWAGKGDSELFTEPGGRPSWIGKGDPEMFSSDLMDVEYYWPRWLTSLGVWLGERLHRACAAFSRFTSNKAP